MFPAMLKFRSIPLAVLALGCLLENRVSAVIVGGANGDGLGNATENGLQSHLTGRALPAFPFWNNLLRVSDSSGIYLGKNATTGRGWVLTATHVTPLTVGSGTITVGGQTYIVRASHIIKHPDSSGTLNSDIRLYAIAGDPGDPALPSLTAVPLLESDVEEGDDLVLTGRGRRRQAPTEDTTEPYEWDWDTSGANQLTRQIRWGTNHVEIYTPAAPDVLVSLSEGPSSNKETVCFASVFDDPAGSGTSAEGQLALLDSGGGVFVRHGVSWYLAGINSYVDDGPDADTQASPSGYGDFSIFPHLPSYRDQIEALTGTLSPASSGPDGDLDGDGISNLMEYALNLDPLVNQQVIMTAGTGLEGLPLVRVENVSGSDRLTVEFVRRTSGVALTYTPLFSNDLQTWLATGTQTVTSIDANWDRVKVVDSQTVPASSKRFARLKVEE